MCRRQGGAANVNGPRQGGESEGRGSAASYSTRGCRSRGATNRSGPGTGAAPQQGSAETEVAPVELAHSTEFEDVHVQRAGRGSGKGMAKVLDTDACMYTVVKCQMRQPMLKPTKGEITDQVLPARRPERTRMHMLEVAPMCE